MCELDGTVLDRPIAAFRIIPYFARQSIALPPIDDLIDIPRSRLQELENSGEDKEFEADETPREENSREDDEVDKEEIA